MSPLPVRLGKYQVLEEIGKGAMGVVYKAYDPRLEREVAVKVMSGAILSDDELKQRFEREAKAIARLQHPNIVTVYDFDYDEHGAPFIAMELLKGTELEQRLRKNPPTLKEKLEIAIQVAQGLAHAHRQGIVHRDIKPANIWVTEAGAVKIMDFGVARMTQSSQTQTGAVMGTPDYMSPEQVAGGHVDGRSDLFSVGVILYRLLTHKKPFVGETIQAVWYKVINQDPPPLMLPDGSEIPELQQIVDRALAKKLDDRYQSGDELAEDVKAFLRMFESSLSEETIFGTVVLEGEPEHSTAGRSRSGTPAPRSTFRPGTQSQTGRLGGTSPGAGRTFRPTSSARAPATVAGRDVSATAAGGTQVVRRTMAPRATVVSPPTRVVRPARVEAAPSRSGWLLGALGILVLGALAGGLYYYSRSSPRETLAPPNELDLTTRFQMAENLLNSGRISEAFEAVDRILEMAPGNSRALELREQIMKASEQAKQQAPPATSTVPVVASPGPAPTPTPPSGPSNAQQAGQKALEASMAINSGDLTRAQALLAEGQRLDPSNPSWSDLSRQLEARRREVDQKNAEQQRLSVAAEQVQRAAGFLAAGDYDQAIASYQEALKLDPRNAAAQNGITQASSLKQQALAQKQALAAPRREFDESETTFVPASGKAEAPRGFETGGGVEVKRATTAPKFPAQLTIELVPENAQPGQPFVLRVRLYNAGQKPIQVKSLELVSTYGNRPPMGKGHPISPRVQRIDAQGTGVLHEASGTWTEEQNRGSIEATVTLVGDDRLVKTKKW
jgi:serine/threonine-protein kinase